MTTLNIRSSFFIKCEEVPSEEAINSGFRWLIESAEKGQKVFLVVPSETFLKGTLQSVLGEPAIRALAKNGRINFNRLFLRLVTTRSTNSLQNAQPSIVPHCI
jgi:hypothetical protein